MCIRNSQEFIDMMNGYFGKFTKYELWSILVNQNELGINTISVQKMNCDEFICKVDKETVLAYKREMGEV